MYLRFKFRLVHAANAVDSEVLDFDLIEDAWLLKRPAGGVTDRGGVLLVRIHSRILLCAHDTLGSHLDQLPQRVCLRHGVKAGWRRCDSTTIVSHPELLDPCCAGASSVSGRVDPVWHTCYMYV